MAINNISSRIRLSGMASGLDTDAIVRDLMKAQRAPLYRLKQQQQLSQWKQQDYRDIISILSDFNKSFMDITNSATNMRSASQYKKFITSVTAANGTSSNVLTATGSVDAYAGKHTVIVTRLATAAKQTSANSVSATLESGDLRGTLELENKKITVSIDGVSKEIVFNSNYTIDSQASGDAFAADLQAKITDAFGVGLNGQAKVNVAYDNESGKISFNTAAGSNKIVINSAAVTDDDGLDALKMSNGASNRIKLTATLESLKDSFAVPGGLVFEADPDDNNVEKIKFTINNKEFSFTKDTKLSTVLSTINNAPTANVNLSYDSITDKFTLVSKQTGSGNNIKITNTLGNFFGPDSVIGIDHTVDGFGNNGLDALVTIDDQELVRSNNSFTEGGVTYNLQNAAPGEKINVSLTFDTEAVFNNIKNFITKYNEVIEKIYSKFTEKYDRDYPPLTDEQKEAMQTSDIEKWEKIAKTGLLSNDSTLNSILTNFRMALVDSIKGVETSLSKIGISSTSYRDRGKLTIDETKLKAAIQNDPDGVMNLFCKQSETLPDYDRKATKEALDARRAEEGIVHRIYDIVQDNISIVMNSNKQKGILLEKAGIAGDTTDKTSALSKEINDRKEAMEELEEKLFEKEEYYYRKFTAMETALSKLNSQTSWISSMLGNLK